MVPERADRDNTYSVSPGLAEYPEKEGFYNTAAVDISGRAGKSRQGTAASEPEYSGERTRASSVILVIVVCVLAGVMLAGVIYSFNRRNSIYNEVSKKSETLDLAEAENIRLHSELESRLSAKNVEDYAENVLGMHKLDSSQIKYIKIQTEDVVSIPEQDDGFLARVRKFFESCVEYFRG
ncbi:MAG: hypothetical protein IJ874_04235 [Ruminococcus sp.]|nr:hypothetical protein [Ruminococcus sp.]